MKKIIIANWKMNLTPAQSVDLVTVFKKRLGKIDDKDVVVCPSFSAMSSVSEKIKKSDLILGSQNISWMAKGAFTGEESIGNIKELNCKYAIVGHSERRQSLGETDEMVNKKIEACLGEGITPIFCIGETLEDKQNRMTDHKLYSQIKLKVESNRVNAGYTRKLRNLKHGEQIHWIDSIYRNNMK